MASSLAEQRRLADHWEAEAKRDEAVRARIRELGFDPDQHCSEWAVRRKLDSLVGRPPAMLANELRRAAQGCLDAADELAPSTGGPLLDTAGDFLDGREHHEFPDRDDRPQWGGLP